MNLTRFNSIGTIPMRPDELEMTLLDYFAGQAMQGDLAYSGLPIMDEADIFAARCYRVARAMVAEKRRLEGQNDD